MSGRRGPPQPGEGDSPTGSPPRKRTRDRRGASSSASRGASAAGRGTGSSSGHVLPPPPVVRRGAAAPAAASGKVDSTLGRYITLGVTVRISDLNFPRYTVRPVRDEEHAVQRFVAPFKDGKYGENENYISIALDPACKINEMDFRKDVEKRREEDPEMWPSVPTQAFPQASFLVVDGAHRVHALRDPELENIPQLRRVRVLLYARRDKRRMASMDYVTVGSRLNDIGSLQNQTTNYERVHSCISVIETIDEMIATPTDNEGDDEEEVEKVKSKDLRAEQIEKFQKERSVANLKAIVAGEEFFASTVPFKKLGPLCMIALALINEPTLLEVTKEASKTSAGFSFLETKALWELDHSLLISTTIRCFLEHRRQKGGTAAPGIFIRRISDLWMLVLEEFEARKIEDYDEGWNLPIPLPGADVDDEDEVEPLSDGFVTRLKKDLKKENIVDPKLWTQVQNDLLARLRDLVKWPKVTLERAPDTAEEMDVDSPAVPRSDPGQQSGAPASKRRASSEGSRSSVSSSSEESGEGGGSEGNSGGSGRGKNSKANKESPEESGVKRGDESSPEGRPAPSRRVAKKGPGGNVARQRVEDASSSDQSSEQSPTPQPWARGKRRRRRTRAAEESSESPVLTTKSGTKRSSKGKRNPPTDKTPHESTPEVSPNESTRRGTRSSKRLQDKGKRTLKDDSVSEDGGSEESPEARRLLEKKLEERNMRLQSLRSKPREGRLRHIRVPDSKRAQVDSGDSSDCDTDFEEVEEEPVKWRMDEFYIPREKRVVDAEGFGLRHSWENGLCYVRPKPFLGAFTKPVLVDPLDVSERGLVKRTGTHKEWWRGTLPDGGKDWLYPDFYSRVVQNLPTKWSLSRLPNENAPEWTLKYHIPTHAPAEDECNFYNCEALLRSLCIRPPHQAHFRLTTKDVLQVRWSVFRFLTRNLGLPEELPSCWDKIASSHFAGLRSELDNKGFLIMEGFVLREETDNGHKSTAWSETSVKDIKALFDFYTKRVPDPDAVVDKHVSRQWTKIRNKKTAARAGGASNARWQSTSWGTNGQLETEENNHVLRARCINEVACWTLVHLLHCGAGSYGEVNKKEKDKKPMLKATDSGSRVLITSANCERQRPHKDYRYFLDPRKMFGHLVKIPGLFSIAFGEKGGELWIVRGSHYFLVLSKERVKGIAEHLPMECVKIPPWSLFIARGDFIHAGIARTDGTTGESTRLHDYYMSVEAAFYDNINDEYEFKTPL